MRNSRDNRVSVTAILALLGVIVSACGKEPVPGAARPESETGPVPGPESSILAADVEELAPPVADPGSVLVDAFPIDFNRVWQPWQGDFDALVERRIIRAVTPYGGYQFYYEDGRPRGATYELLMRFEKFLNEKLERQNLKIYVVAIPVGRDELIPALLEGHADLVAADLTITSERAGEVTFSQPLLRNISEVVVTGTASPVVEQISDLSGNTVVVRASSSYYEHLVQLSDGFVATGLQPIDIVAADELLEAEDLLEMLGAGLLPLTVMDDYKAKFWNTVFPDINVRDDLVVNQDGEIAWAVRQDAPGFEAVINEFLQKFGRGTMVGDDTYNRYLSDASRVRCSHTPQAYDELQDLVAVFQQYGEQYDFDWLMLAAQAYQESGLDQSRVSRAGAVGLMQVRPATASDRNVNVTGIDTIDGNVHAGAKYMRFIADRYFAGPEMDELSQWVFSLAAYNAGPARVASLRREAEESGYDPNRWFDNVEIIAAKRIGRETPTYVSNVFKYYVGYELTVTRGAVRGERFANELEQCVASNELAPT